MSTAACCKVPFALLLVWAVGCSQPEFLEVSGTVNWQGNPVEVGEIIFHPTDPSVSAAAGRIRGGAFKFLSKCGKMRVDIQAVRKTGKRDPIEGFEITELYIPEKFNARSELEIEVTRDAENHFTFDLTDG
ncbi:hypothetical protein [Lacipirellula sp.]|uniref:hypothetical protein n=1 Tax=Lacipirellula sp. TaxID=2691419 RepID=UPI003D0BF330